MTDEEIEAYRERLNELTKQCLDGKTKEHTILERLQKLAREVGASTRVFYVGGIYSKGGQSDAQTAVLIHNIHQALQTAAMVNMCRTATEGYKTATEASNSARWEFRAMAAIAFLSVVAAWVAALRN